LNQGGVYIRLITNSILFLCLFVLDTLFMCVSVVVFSDY
jgi:hypothetical protein